MGISSSSIFKSKLDVKILMLGLDGGGKTTILYKLMLNEVVSTISTSNYNVETIQHKHLNLTLWDLPIDLPNNLASDERVRSIWKPFYNKCSAIIFVVDSSDRLRIDEAAAELNKLMNEDSLKGCTLLIFATKQDCIFPMDVPEITDRLGLHEIKDRKWYIQPTKNLEGLGIEEGISWLTDKIIEEQKHSKSFFIPKFNSKNKNKVKKQKQNHHCINNRNIQMS